MNHEKNKIRKNILSKRTTIDKIFVEAASRKIHERLFKTKEFHKADIIMFYVSKHNEVDTHTMIDSALKAGKKICAPCTDKKNNRLHPVLIEHMGRDLNIGNFGILEPKKTKGKTISANKLDLIVTPGIAFDETGHRLGWGKGYYDRFLEQTGETHKIGLAFEFQIVHELPKDKHDIPVDMVITEKRILKLNTGSKN